MLIKVNHSDTTLRTFILFVQTAHAVLKYIDSHFYREGKLSAVKFITLQALAFNGGSMTPSEIAEWTNRERNNITTLVERMKRDGLVTTERNKRDKRSINVSLTDKGQEVLKEAMYVAREITNQAMSSIDEGDTLLLEQSLEILRQNAHDGLEEATKLSPTQLGRTMDSPPAARMSDLDRFAQIRKDDIDTPL